jgi:hypothetical protein
VATRDADWLVRAPGDVDRIEARFSGVAYAPHRHDTYAIGMTLEGLQTFDYRPESLRTDVQEGLWPHPERLANAMSRAHDRSIPGPDVRDS